MRRIGEAVHACHNEQYERKVEETGDGYNDEHFIGRVAHAVRGGVQHVRWCPGRRRVVATRHQHVVSVMVPNRGRPSVWWCHFVVFPVVPYRPSVVVDPGRASVVTTAADDATHPAVTTAADAATASNATTVAVVFIHCFRSTVVVAAGHCCSTAAVRARRHRDVAYLCKKKQNKKIK